MISLTGCLLFYEFSCCIILPWRLEVYHVFDRTSYWCWLLIRTVRHCVARLLTLNSSVKCSTHLFTLLLYFLLICKYFAIFAFSYVYPRLKSSFFYLRFSIKFDHMVSSAFLMDFFSFSDTLSIYNSSTSVPYFSFNSYTAHVGYVAFSWAIDKIVVNFIHFIASGYLPRPFVYFLVRKRSRNDFCCEISKIADASAVFDFFFHEVSVYRLHFCCNFQCLLWH